MRIFRRVLSRRRTLGFVAVAALLFGLAMLHPYPRQSLFGPTIRGKPWCVWEAEVRQQCGEPKNETLADRLRQWLDQSRPTAMSIDEMFDHPEMAPLVVAMLDDSDSRLSFRCVEAINSFPCLRVRSALALLRKRYANEDIDIRLSAAEAIYRIEKDEEIFHWFLKQLDHPDPKVHSRTMANVAHHSKDAPEFYPHIVAHAKDDNYVVRSFVMIAMQHFEKKGVPTLIDGMTDREDTVRKIAVVHAERLGAHAESAIPALEKVCSHDSDSDVRAMARSALQSIRRVASQNPANERKWAR